MVTLSTMDAKLQAVYARRRTNTGSRAFVTPDDVHSVLRRNPAYRSAGGTYVTKQGYANVFRRSGWSLVGFVPSARAEARSRLVGAYRYTGK